MWGLLTYPPSRPTELVSVGFGFPHSAGVVRIRKVRRPETERGEPGGDTSTAPVGATTGWRLMLRRCANCSNVVEKDSKSAVELLKTLPPQGCQELNWIRLTSDQVKSPSQARRVIKDDQ